MPCDANCGTGICTTIQRAGLHIVNYTIDPAQPIAGSTVNITVRVENDNPQNSFTDVCIFDRDTNTCIADSGFQWIVGPFSHLDYVIPITMPNYNYNIQITTREQELSGVLYYCGDFRNLTIPLGVPAGTTWGCNKSSGKCEPGYGTMTDPNCFGQCTGGGGLFKCSPACSAQEMCVLGGCVPKPIIFMGAALAALMIFMKE